MSGQGYGYMFHGAFSKKADAVAKERKTKGAWIKGTFTKQGYRYVVMSPRTNPRRTRKRARKNAEGGLMGAQMPGRMRVWFDKAIGRFAATKYHEKYGNVSATGHTKKQAAKNLRDEFRRIRKAGTWRVNPSLIGQVQHGDRVTILVPAGIGRHGQEWKQRTGRAVMRSSHGGWVLNMGGAHGTPGIADESNIVRVKKSARNPADREQAREIAVAAYRKMGDLLAAGKHGQSDKLRMKLAKLNAREGWTMAEVAQMAREANPATKVHKHFPPHTGFHKGSAERAYEYADQMRAKYPGRKVDVIERSDGSWDVYVLNEPGGNPSELIVMAANPGSEGVEVRANPINPGGLYTAAHARAAGIARPLGWTPFQKRIAKLVRKASGSEAAQLSRSYARHRVSRPSRAASKVFHELYGREENPREVCGRMIGGLPCSRKPGHKGPHLPQGATLRPRSRHNWNPSAAALRETFTGADPTSVKVYDEPHMPAGDYAQLGELLALYVKPVAGGQVQQLMFPRGARPRLVSDESARQIYFVSGDQDLGASLSSFSARQRGDGLFELGEARRIDYKQRKEHVPEPEVDEWKHNFGEESGVRPTLFYDAGKKRLLLEGGEYVIRAEGIVN